jgi:putative ABC transport system substrate-binding protein
LGEAMRRRDVFPLLVGTAAWPLVARAQQPERMRRIEVLVSSAEEDSYGQARVSGFRESLAKAGWTEGHDVKIDTRWGITDRARAQELAKEIVALGPDLILTQGSPITQALKQATTTIPVVFLGASDPLGSGLVTSLAHPGGNVTGFTNFEFSFGGKWLATLKEIAPKVKRVLVIFEAENLGNLGLLRTVEAVAPSLPVQISKVSTGAEIEGAITEFAREPDGALLVMPTTITLEKRDSIVALAARYCLPAIYPARAFIASGGLMSYDTDIVDLFRKAALYVDRILRGGKPGDLPVQAPTKFDLVINLKTAKALGLEIPSALLAIADEVIE